MSRETQGKDRKLATQFSPKAWTISRELLYYTVSMFQSLMESAIEIGTMLRERGGREETMTGEGWSRVEF